MWIAFKYGTGTDSSRFLGVYTDRSAATTELCKQFPTTPYRVNVFADLTDLSVGYDIVGQVYPVNFNESVDIEV